MTDQQVIDTEATEETDEGQEAGQANGQPDGTGQQLAPRPDRTPLSQRDPVSLAKHFAQSGYFQDARQMSQAVVKIVAGEELGFGPMTAMAGIHIIEGKPALSANLIGTLVKRSGAYNFRVVDISDQRAELAFFEHGEEIGRSSFTIEQAKRAHLIKDKSGWTKYPEAMLFARALTQGVRWHCPDVAAGSPAYTPEELGAEVDERGEVISLPEPHQVPAPAPAKAGIDSERVDRLEEQIKASVPTYKALDLLLGSIGIDALRARSAQARRERLESLNGEQADALEAELKEIAEDGHDE